MGLGFRVWGVGLLSGFEVEGLYDSRDQEFQGVRALLGWSVGWFGVEGFSCTV